jgi:hypothetical protein
VQTQFTVPQFIDAEDKIIGPITVRQFVILLIAGLLATLFYRLFDFSLFLLTAVPLLLFAGLLAFMKVNGVPVHFFILNVIQTFRRPALRVWDKSLTDAEIRARMRPEEEVVKESRPTKAPLNLSRMSDLSLLVNTGGVYNPEDQGPYGTPI